MRKKVAILCYGVIIMILLSCTNNKSSNPIEGVWITHYEDNANIDTISITVNDTVITMSSLDKSFIYPPIFKNVSFKKEVLSYEMHFKSLINTYELKLTPDKRHFKGVLYTWKKTKKEITLEKTD